MCSTLFSVLPFPLAHSTTFKSKPPFIKYCPKMLSQRIFSPLISLQMKILLVFVCENHFVVHPKSPCFVFLPTRSTQCTHTVCHPLEWRNPLFGILRFLGIETYFPAQPSLAIVEENPLAFTAIYFLAKFKSSGPSSHLCAQSMTVNTSILLAFQWRIETLEGSMEWSFRWKFINVSLKWTASLNMQVCNCFEFHQTSEIMKESKQNEQ